MLNGNGGERDASEGTRGTGEGVCYREKEGEERVLARKRKRGERASEKKEKRSESVLASKRERERVY